MVWPGFNTSTDGYSCRRQYHAMVNLLDGVVAEITDALVSRAMWEHTLMVFSSVSLIYHSKKWLMIVILIMMI